MNFEPLPAFSLFSHDLPMTTEYTKREVIESKLLAGLEDGSHAAMLLGKDDLMLIVQALDAAKDRGSEQFRGRCENMYADVRKLYNAVFG